MQILKITRTLLLACFATIMAVSVQAQQYPSKPIRILIGFAAGGGTDLIARLYATKLSEVLKTPIVVENRPGAQEFLAAQPVMTSVPDGYTLWLGSSGALAQAPGVRSDTRYDTLKDFTLIHRVTEVEAVFAVRNGLPINSVNELVTYAKANPGKLNYASAGLGAGNHLLVEYVQSLTGIKMTHIPYKSDTEVVREIAGGSVDFGVPSAVIAVPFAADGRIKPIAVTGSERLKGLPNVPSVGEGDVKELKALGVYAWHGLVGPAGLPPAIIQTLNEAMNKVARMPDVRERLDNAYLRPLTGTTADFHEYISKELTRWREIGKTVRVGS